MVEYFQKRSSNLRRQPLQIKAFQDGAQVFVGPKAHLTNLGQVSSNSSQFARRDFLKIARPSAPQFDRGASLASHRRENQTALAWLILRHYSSLADGARKGFVHSAL